MKKTLKKKALITGVTGQDGAYLSDLLLKKSYKVSYIVDNNINKINSLKKFCERDLGKGTLICNDTPGFLGNRIGVYAMQVAMTEAFKMKLTIEEADAVFGRPMGIPKTGVFGLYDLIGIDLMADVLKSFIKELPENDEFQQVAKEIPLVKNL